MHPTRPTSASNHTFSARLLSAPTVFSTVLSLALLLLAAGSAQAQETKITADDGDVNDQFGRAVAISADGERALVGTPFDDLDGGNEGSVYVFNRQSDGTWLQQDTLTVSNVELSNSFGRAIAISPDGQHAVVDLRLEESAYVFDRQSDGFWVQQAVLTASDGESDDNFGISVAISDGGERVLVGAYFDNRNGEFDVGSAYAFSRQSDGSYVEEEKLIVSNGDEGDNFGNSVSITPDGQRALIGARGDGSAYVFDRQSDGTWTQQDNFEDVDGDLFNDFGRAVSISSDGQRALVGADGDVDGGFSNQGSAYVFDRQSDGTWTQQAEFIAADGGNDDHLGISVALSGDGQRALLGANQDDVNGNERQGSAYVIARQPDGAWVQQVKLTASDGEETDRFGGAVAISADGQRGLVGAHKDDVNGTLTQGSVYEYGPASLPVELAAFTARSDGRAAVLSWQTASETNNAGFRVERHTDDTDPWTRMGFVESQAESGTSAEPLTYRFRAEALDVGAHAFRLVQTDLDGSTTPSETVTVHVGLDAAFALSAASPNPLRGRGTVEVAVRRAQEVTAHLYDVMGRRVRVLHDGPMAEQTTHRLAVNAQSLPSGIYFVRVVGETFAASRKVVVVR